MARESALPLTLGEEMKKSFVGVGWAPRRNGILRPDRDRNAHESVFTGDRQARLNEVLRWVLDRKAETGLRGHTGNKARANRNSPASGARVNDLLPLTLDQSAETGP
jgi:hypothetical protein